MKILTIIEFATIISAVGTLGLAITSVYQMRRGRKDALHPMVYADSIWLDAVPNDDTQLLLHRICIHLKNYGTGPALDVQFWARTQLHVQLPQDGQAGTWFPLRIGQLVRAGQAVEFMNLAPNQEALVELRLVAEDNPSLRAGQPLVIQLGYRSVFREHLRREFTSSVGAGHSPLTHIAGTR